MSREAPKSVVWLHLSDLHSCVALAGRNIDQVLITLTEDLHGLRDAHGLSPDLIFFTGDAAHGQIGTEGSKKLSVQFDDALRFLESVRTACNLEKDRMFLVPGNHDIDRSRVAASETFWLDNQSSAKAIGACLREGGVQWQRFMERLEAYREFLTKAGYHHLLKRPDHLIYATELTLAGVKLGIAGLNSAWSCCRNGERGHLWLGGEWQIVELATDLELAKVNLRIGLMHHPSSWIVEHEDPPLRRRLEEQFDILLSGHEHDDWVWESKNRHVHIAAGALYDPSLKKYGYNLVRLFPETGNGEIWMRELDPATGRWGQHVIHMPGTTDEHGCWRLDSLRWRISPTIVRTPGGSSPSKEPTLRVSELHLRTRTDQLFGRDQLLEKLDAEWVRAVSREGSPTKIVVLHAWSGVGKTSLVAEWMRRMARDQWRKAERVFDWTFYGRRPDNVSASPAKSFIHEALCFFGKKEVAERNMASGSKGILLAELVSQHRTLLVLDGLEVIQSEYQGGGQSPQPARVLDPEVSELLRALAVANRGLCIITTQRPVYELAQYGDIAAPHWRLDSLPDEEGARLLHYLGVQRFGASRILANDPRLAQLSREVRGHALTLTLLGRYLKHAHDGDLAKRERGMVRLYDTAREHEGGHAFRVMKSHEARLETEDKSALAMLRLLSLCDLPDDEEILLRFCAPPYKNIPELAGILENLSAEKLSAGRNALVARGLLIFDREKRTVDCHPLIRSYFSTALRVKFPGTWRAVHLRLAELLNRQLRPLYISLAKSLDRPGDRQPISRDDVVQIFKEMRHLCLAGKSAQALRIYHTVIERGKRAQLNHPNVVLNDLGALTHFFLKQWTDFRPGLPKSDQVYILNLVGMELWHVGLLGESLGVLESAKNIVLKQRVFTKRWCTASRLARRQCEVALFLGRLPLGSGATECGTYADAESLARQAIAHALRGKEKGERSAAGHLALARMALAYTHFLSGREAEAREIFASIPRAPDGDSGDIGRLHEIYLIYRFYYVELLTDAKELKAASEVVESIASAGHESLLVTALVDLFRGWLGSLGAGRESARSNPEAYFNWAVLMLQDTGQDPHIVRGLFLRARYYDREGRIEAARRDLREALHIAARGQMQLYQADLRLFCLRTRARFKDPEDTAETSLNEAIKLIEKIGYEHRKSDIESAKILLKTLTDPGENR